MMKESEYLNQKITFKLWHGTSEKNAKNIQRTKKWLKTVDNDKPYFGNGVYFMLNNRNFACFWAKLKPIHPYSILCFVEVERKYVFDLANDRAYKLYEVFSKKVVNGGHSSSIINLICDKMPVKVVVGYYSLGPLNDVDKATQECRNQAVKIQIQVAVRDADLIQIDHIEKCG